MDDFALCFFGKFDNLIRARMTGANVSVFKGGKYWTYRIEEGDFDDFSFLG